MNRWDPRTETAWSPVRHSSDACRRGQLWNSPRAHLDSVQAARCFCHRRAWSSLGRLGWLAPLRRTSQGQHRRSHWQQKASAARRRRKPMAWCVAPTSRALGEGPRAIMESTLRAATAGQCHAITMVAVGAGLSRTFKSTRRTAGTPGDRSSGAAPREAMAMGYLHRSVLRLGSGVRGQSEHSWTLQGDYAKCLGAGVRKDSAPPAWVLVPQQTRWF
mmetsp:Transcript_118717/g.335816  ORF Transcript_118717/g.335816 Transcript_118717/m.335816 type:complete len:217 (-) Transcript_118717:638-1288(-)